MVINIEAVIWYLFLIDSIGANIMAWCCAKWYKKKYKGWMYKHFPAAKGWILSYLILVLWVGYALYRLGVLPY
ncbi:MAG TPA: hypothetical protein ENH46_01305 [Candidatus Pacearchaeota archaeon]|nr:hypothetical protein [Candidatus Pacearchaeota archaeon]